jgi:hypothetical protein
MSVIVRSRWGVEIGTLSISYRALAYVVAAIGAARYRAHPTGAATQTELNSSVPGT